VDDLRFSWIVHFGNLPPPYCTPHCYQTVAAGLSARSAAVVFWTSRKTDMTALQDAIAHDTVPHGSGEARAPTLPLVPSEPRALIAILSAAKRNALLACLTANGLHKKAGAWHGLADGKPVSGVTVADLARDGMLTLTTDHRLASARLTERGSWFARTLLRDASAAK
jgi:hypothetical protein